MKVKGSYRLEARGFCTQPAHAVRGDGAVLVSTFEFAGLVTYRCAEGRERPDDRPLMVRRGSRGVLAGSWLKAAFAAFTITCAVASRAADADL